MPVETFSTFLHNLFLLSNVASAVHVCIVLHFKNDNKHWCFHIISFDSSTAPWFTIKARRK